LRFDEEEKKEEVYDDKHDERKRKEEDVPTEPTSKAPMPHPMATTVI
jgi:hypothetical protein